MGEKLSPREAARRLGLTVRRLGQLVAGRRGVPSIGRPWRRRYLWPELRMWRDKELLRQGAQLVRATPKAALTARELELRSSVTQIELTKILGVTPATVYSFQAKGIPIVRDRHERVRYAWPASLRWFIQHRAAILARHPVQLADDPRDEYVLVPLDLWQAVAHSVVRLDAGALRELQRTGKAKS